MSTHENSAQARRGRRASPSARRWLACTLVGIGLFLEPLPVWSQPPAVRAPAPARPLPNGPVANQPAPLQNIPLGPGAPGKVDALIADIQETETNMNVNLQRSKLLRTRIPVSRVSIVNPNVIEVVQYGPQEFELIGRQIGQTTLTFWFAGLEQTPVLRYQVSVTRDPDALDQRRLEYADLQKMVNEMFPNSMVFLIPVADKLVVKGQARDSEEVTQIMALITGRGVNQQGGLFIGPYGGTAALPFPDSTLPTSTVVNLLEVPGEQQVMLKVRVAELSRTALRDMSVSWDAIIGNNTFLVSLLSGAPNVVSVLKDGDVQILLRLLSTNGMSKILAEPNLVTLSGHPASFIAGGEFAVPTIVGVGGAQAATTQFRGFGAQLSFTPTVIDKDRIRLQVNPEFSQLNAANSVNGIPGLNTRAANTTVEMREGQWLALAGLVQDEQTGSSSRIPFVGDVPVLRSMFGNKTVRRGETELIVLVSPELVHPMEPEDLPPLLPGMEVNEPNDLRFFICGQIEGQPRCDHRSTVYPKYHDDIKDARHEARHARRYQQRQDYYFSGPHGFSD